MGAVTSNRCVVLVFFLTPGRLTLQIWNFFFCAQSDTGLLFSSEFKKEREGEKWG